MENVCDSDFLAELGLASNDGSIVVEGYHDTRSYEFRSSAWVHSALISPETARALVRALQTVNDSWDYRIPPEGDKLEINVPPYGRRVRYLTLGGGLQLPLASVRPSVGYSLGRVSREEGLADDASRTVTIGLTVDRGSRLRIGAQYRLRLDEGYMTWYKSHQWLGGISVRVF